MKKLMVLAMVFLGGVMILSRIAFAEIERKEDRFTNSISFGTKPSPSLSHPWLATYMNFKGGEKQFLCMFISSNESWRYLTCHSVYLLIDGKPFRSIKTQHRGSVGRGYVLEFIKTDLTFEEIKEISKATKVEFKICNDVWELARFPASARPSNLDDLKTFVSMVEEIQTSK
jgi:hypothetical protein